MHFARSTPAALALAWLSACTSVPVAAVPDPLPETIEWAASGTPEGGAFLGLEVRENDSGSLEELSFDPGVRVTRVNAGSPAEQAGFQVGDVLLRWNGEEVPDPTTLDVLLERADPGAAAVLEVQRGDSIFEVSVAPRARTGAASEARLLWRADAARSRAGWLAGHGGVVLVTSIPDGPFPEAGVSIGSVVTHIDGEPQRSERALIRAFLERAPGSAIDVAYRDADSATDRQTVVTLYDPPRRVTAVGVPILFDYDADVNGDATSFTLLDLWILSLFQYRREGGERYYSVLSVFDFATGVGELGEGE